MQRSRARGKRRSYTIDPVTAHNRAVIGGQSRTGADYHIRKLGEAAESLTDQQKRRLAALLMPFTAEGCPPGSAGGEAA